MNRKSRTPKTELGGMKSRCTLPTTNKSRYDDRSSYIYSGGSINGLYAQPKPKSAPKLREKLPIIEKEYKDLGELAAFTKILEQEAKTKDSLIEILTERCTKAESELESAVIEKAKLEREIAAFKYNVHQKSESDNNLTNCIQQHKRKIEELEKELREEQNENQLKETQLLHLSSQFQETNLKLKVCQRDLDTERQKGLTENDELKRQVNLLSRTLQQERGNSSMIDDSIKALTQEKDEFATKYEQASEALKELLEKHQQIESRFVELEKKNNKLRKSNAVQSERLDFHEKDRRKLIENFQRQEERIKNLEKLKAEAEDLQQNTLDRCKRLQHQFQNVTKKTNFLESKVKATESKLLSANEKCKKLSVNLETQQKAFDALRQRYAYNNHISKMNQAHTLNNDNESKKESKDEKIIPSRRARSVYHQEKLVSKDRRDEIDDTKKLAVRSRTKKSAYRRGAVPKMIDPAKAPDSDAPDWMKY